MQQHFSRNTLTRAKPFGQFISCTSAKAQPDPNSNAIPNLNPDPLGPLGGSRSTGAIARLRPLHRWRFFPKTERLAETPVPTNQTLVLHELFSKVVLQLGPLVHQTSCVSGVRYDTCPNGKSQHTNTYIPYSMHISCSVSTIHEC